MIKQKGVRVGAVSNAFKILRWVLAHPRPVGVNPIARATGVSPSSCFNILQTLVAEAILEFDPTAKTYVRGPGLRELLPTAPDERAAFDRCAPLLAKFAEEYSTTVALWRVTPSERLILLGFADSPTSTRIHMTLGQRLPLLAGAGGRCVAASLGLSSETVAEHFKDLRWQKPPSLASYKRQVAEAARLGWAIDDGEFLNGVTTLAAAITDGSSEPRHVVGATFFQGQFPPSTVRKIGVALIGMVPEIQASLSA